MKKNRKKMTRKEKEAAGQDKPVRSKFFDKKLRQVKERLEDHDE
jgi:hypothetical protein